MQMITKAIQHKRGKDFSVTVTYSSFNDHIAYSNIVMPALASDEVKEAFLAEAETAMLNLIDSEWDADTYASGIYRGMME